jgi:hypothetical protein
MKKYLYTAPDGLKYPLSEAPSDMAFMAYMSDRKKAKIGDPNHCILALGIGRNKDVLHCYIGSGKDAYVVYKGEGTKPPFCLHYTVDTKAARVRDLFDTKGAPKTQVIWLRHPTRARTLAARRMLDKRRREEIKAGSPVKPRGPQKNPRITRLGVVHRPLARIVNGEVSLASAVQI